MSETLHSRNRVRIVVEMQSGNNAISKLAKVRADTKMNTMRTVVLNGHGLNVTVAAGQHKPIAMNIKQRIIGTRGKQKGEPMSDLISRQAAIDALEAQERQRAAQKRKYTFGNDEFSLEAAYHDCKLVFDGITDDDSFQEADTGLILYYANEIIYALQEAL